MRDAISQEELEVLDALDRKRKAIDAERKAPRWSILARLEQGCPVVPGRWRVRRRESNVRRLTFAAIESLCGEDFVRDLRGRLELKEYVWLKLLESR
jgi:hypothetical protein